MLHQVGALNIAAMIISVGGLFLLTFALSYLPDSLTEGYLYVADWVAKEGCFWLFGHLFIPVSCILLDLLEFSFGIFFSPNNEIILREAYVREEKTSAMHSTFPLGNKIHPASADFYEKNVDI
jgi:hypothetical protein